MPDGEHHRNIGRRDSRQVGEIPGGISPHLYHDADGIAWCGQHREWEADLVVEARAICMHDSGRSQHVDQQVFGGGLAHRAGHRDHARPDSRAA